MDNLQVKYDSILEQVKHDLLLEQFNELQVACDKKCDENEKLRATADDKVRLLFICSMCKWKITI